MPLNSRQQAAVRHIDSPLLVLAGAGSGKTRVITEKIAWLIAAGHFRAEAIAAITFTNKAAREMRQRVTRAVRRKAARGLTISTFHSLGWQILRSDPEAAGRRSGISILDAHAAGDLLRELLPGAADAAAVRRAQWAVGDFKDRDLDPQAALAQAVDRHAADAARIYAAYQQRLDELNAVDFDDLIAVPARMLSDPVFRTRWRARLRYVLVDEYQDTSAAQYRLLRNLVGDSGAFTAVGDDDQSIYGWRGARPENLEHLARDYPRLEVIKLEQNYRSSGRILGAANAVIACNPHTFEKRLWSELGPGELLRVHEYADEADEAEGVARELVSARATGRMRWRDAAVLYRSNFQARVLEKALREYAVPYRLSGGPSWFDAREIRDGLSYLRLLADPEDNPAFLRVANTPRRGLGSASLARLLDHARAGRMSLFAAAVDTRFQRDLPERGARALRGFTNMLIDFHDRAGRNGDWGRLFAEMLEHVDYAGWIAAEADDPVQARRRQRSLADLAGWVQRIGGEVSSGAELVARVTLAAGPDDDRDDAGADEVRLSTLHAAKGLEFPRVWLAGLEEGLLPHRNSLEEGRLEEERRLMYVGLTRAGRELQLSYCRHRRQYGERTECSPSRFLDELPPELLEWPARDNRPPPDAAEARGNIAALKALLDG